MSASVSLMPLFAFAIFPFELVCSPGDAIQWNHQLVIDSGTIGDVLIGKWNVRMSGPVLLRFPVNVATTPHATLSDVYGEMGRRRLSPFAMSNTISNSSSPVGKIITTHAHDGPRRYSIRSQVQFCDLSLIGYHIC